jgi:hypothetical protein
MIPSQIYGTNIQMMGFPGPQVVDVFNPYEGVADLNAAFAAWTSLCPNTQGAPGNSYCCIRVFMDDNYRDFADPLSDLDVPTSYHISNSTCRIRCDKTYDLYENFSDVFLYQGKDPFSNPVTASFYSGPYSPLNKVDELYGDVVSWRRWMMYEFGRAMGLLSIDDGAPVSCPGSIDMVMNDPMTDDDAGELTDDDKCAFIKLYCPDAVGLGPALGVETGESQEFSLSQNLPNPFNIMTTIPYSLSKRGMVKLAVFDEAGREVKILVDQDMEIGAYTVGFHADDAMPAGAYWYVLQVDGATVTKQMILVK